MLKITLANEKGGVGKTTLATHIAAGLACRGKRVILVDCDPQANSTIMFGLAKEPGLYNLLVRQAEFTEVLRAVPGERFGIPGELLPTGKLWVLPSNIETRNIANSVSDVGIIGQRFEEMEDKIDAVIFDTSPTPSLLHGTIYVATDALIYATKAEMWSFDGLVEAWAHRAQAEKYRRDTYELPPIKVAGIVPTMVRAGTIEHRQNLDDLKKQFGDLVWQPIPERIIWTEATKFKCPVYGLDPNSEAAADVWELIDRVQGMREMIRVKVS